MVKKKLVKNIMYRMFPKIVGILRKVKHNQKASSFTIVFIILYTIEFKRVKNPITNFKLFK